MNKVNENEGKCPLAKKCGGCQLQNMTYPEQLSFKQVKVIKLLGRFCHVDEIIGMENPYHYRCKVQAAFSERNGRIISGVYQSSTHNIIPVDSCMTENEKADSIIVSIRKLMKSFKLRAFDDTAMRGFLRHVLIRVGHNTGEIMVVMVTGSPAFPSEKAFITALTEEHPEITTIVQNINNRYTSLVLGEKNRVLYGRGYIEDTLCGCRFRISPAAFYQINPVQTEVLYNTAAKFAELTGDERVLDAYCGTGTIGLILSKSAKEVIGVELNHDAVADAKVNASMNKAENIRFIEADAGKFMLEAAAEKLTFDTVIMDPPRSGSDMNFLKSLVTLSPKNIVYVSCNPETQARDLDYLVKHGYKAKKIQPVDMFPWTEHVETVVLLSRNKE